MMLPGASSQNSNMELFADTKACGCQDQSPLQHDSQFPPSIPDWSLGERGSLDDSESSLPVNHTRLCLA